MGTCGVKHQKTNGLARSLSLALVVGALALLARGAAPRTVAAAGDTFLRLTTNLSDSASLLSAYPDVAVSANGQYIAVAWQEQASGDGEKAGYIYVRCAQEGSSQGWGVKTAVPGSYNKQTQLRGQTPAVALDGNALHVVWSGGYNGEYNYIYYQYATIEADSSLKWPSGVVQIVASVANTELSTPDVALDENGRPHVVWQQEAASGERQVYYSRHNGTAWQASQQVSLLTGDDNRAPAIAVWGTTAYVVWVALQDDGTGDDTGRVYFANSSNWSGSVKSVYDGLNDHRYKARNPAIAMIYEAGKEVLWVGVAWDVWEDVNDNGDVDSGDRWWLYYRRSVDGGSTWETRQSLGSTFYPHAAGGDEYVQSVRPSLFYSPDPDDMMPHIALARSSSSNFSGGMSTYHYAYDGASWSSQIMPLGSTASSNERGAARLVIGAYDGEFHPHYVYQAVVGQVSGQNRWDVFYTSDVIYYQVRLPIVMRNHD